MSKLWLLSFALEQPGSPCEHVLIGEGPTFDAAFTGERAQNTVPEGQWDVIGYPVPLGVRQFYPELKRGTHMSQGEAEELFGPRRVWDWRARPGSLRYQGPPEGAQAPEGPQRYGDAATAEAELASEPPAVDSEPPEAPAEQ